MKRHQDDPLSQCMPPGVPRINLSTADAPVKLLKDTELIETYCENEKAQAHKR